MAKQRQLSRHVETETFRAFVALAIAQISTNPNTANAYSRDVDKWIAFCQAHDINVLTPRRQEVAEWVAEMIAAGIAPKTRTRRVSALCSVYRELRRDLADKDGKSIPPVVLVVNPFSVDDGPRREANAHALTPTPVAHKETVQALLGACDALPLGVRDRAIIRVLWGTGIRRASLVAMMIERLERVDGGFETVVLGKGNKQIRIRIRGAAARELTAWLGVLRESGIVKGPLWRAKFAPLTTSGVWHAIRRRAVAAKIVERISPHMFRVAFITYNKASLEAKQEGAGHADPATTKGYDRTQWRGREAFEGMPEVEDV
jgi:integrase/recombinase XerD